MSMDTWIEITQQRARNVRYATLEADAIRKSQRIAILAAFKGIDRDKRLRILSKMLDRKITSVDDIQYREAILILGEIGTKSFKELIKHG